MRIRNILNTARHLVIIATMFISFSSSSMLSFAAPLFQNSLAKEVSKSSEFNNWVISPFSIQIPLCCLAVGAEGQTKKEFESVVLTGTGHDPWKELSAKISQVRRNNEVNLATGIYLRKGFPLLAEFLKKLKKFDREGVCKQIEFTKEDMEEINQWVEIKTKGMIKDLIPKNDVYRNIAAIGLVNAIHLESSWVHEFMEKDTHEEQFLGLSSTDNVQMMSQKQKDYNVTMKYPLADDKHLTVSAIQLPLGEPTDFMGGVFFSMVVVKVDQYNEIDFKKLDNDQRKKVFREMELSLGQEKLEDIIDAMEQKEVNVKMPRFKVESKKTLSLRKVLTDMGLKTAFEDGQANFYGINGAGNLFLGELYHKAILEVDEKGLKAAAATYAITSNCRNAEQPVNLYFDCSFMAFVLHTDESSKNTVIVFQATVYDPPTNPSAIPAN